MAGDPINDIVNQICFLSFFHKSRTWEHEREARIYFPFHAFKKIDFDRHEFVGIILGPKSSPQLEDRLQETIREAGSSVQIHKATLSSNDFRVVLPEPFSNL
jgi:hypothetical protein